MSPLSSYLATAIVDRALLYNKKFSVEIPGNFGGGRKLKRAGYPHITFNRTADYSVLRLYIALHAARLTKDKTAVALQRALHRAVEANIFGGAEAAVNFGTFGNDAIGLARAKW